MSGDGTLRYACSMCGVRAPEGGTCGKCKADAMMDILDRDQRGVLERIDRRRMRKRSNRLKSVAVLGGIFVGGLLFTLLAGAGFGLGHFVADWALRIGGSALIAGVFWAVLERMFGDARMFPFLDEPLPKARLVERNQ